HVLHVSVSRSSRINTARFDHADPTTRVYHCAPRAKVHNVVDPARGVCCPEDSSTSAQAEVAGCEAGARPGTGSELMALWALTGGTGYIGTQLAAALVARGDHVQTLARRDATIIGDIRDDEAVRRLVRGADVVVHLAAF